MTVTICFAADNDFAMPLGVTIQSVVATHTGSTPLELIVVDGGIRGWNRRRLEAIVAPFEHTRLEFRSVRGTRFSKIQDDWIREAAFYRLAIPELVPERDKILYLDSDLIVRRDVEDLWDLPMDGAPLAGVVDAPTQVLARSTPLEPHLADRGIDRGAPYLNTGVYLWDLAHARKEGVAEACREVIQTVRLRFGDQDALNLVLGGRCKLIDPRWNQVNDVFRLADADLVMTGMPTDAEGLERLRKEPFITHFTGSTKPWYRSSQHPFRDEFYEVLDETPWRGWRPNLVHSTLGRIERTIDKSLVHAGF